MKLVVVAGSSGFIGAKVAESFLQSGENVLGTYFSRNSEIDRLSAQYENFQAFRLDIGDQSAINELIKAIGDSGNNALSLVSCIGKTGRGHFLTTSKELVDDLFDVNIKNQIWLGRIFIRKMLHSKRGRIVFIGSYAARNGLAGQAAYAASKAALEVWVKSIVREFPRSSGLTVNVVAPGALNDNSNQYTVDEMESVVERIGLSKLGEANDVARMVRFLCSEEASYLTGAVFPVDGGAYF